MPSCRTGPCGPWFAMHGGCCGFLRILPETPRLRGGWLGDFEAPWRALTDLQSYFSFCSIAGVFLAENSAEPREGA